MSDTTKNLEAAFAGESQANRRYLFFAQKAEAEGRKHTARLFRAAADAETVHARNHFDVLEQVLSTKENLQAAVAGEHYEFTSMYPGFIDKAQSEGDKRAARSFDLANKVEQVHHGLFQNALQAVDRGDIADKPIFVCQVCGNTVEGSPPDKCPICGSPKSVFKEID